MRIPRAEEERVEAALQAMLAAERKRLVDANRLLCEARKALDTGLPVFCNQVLNGLHDDSW